MLVELGFVDRIFLNFLIVGHTHCSIDQYFSVLTRAIKKCSFIGSPMALWNLYAVAHKNEKRRPSINKLIEVVYDMKAMLKPYLNPAMYFTIPHVFVFHLRFSKCVLQYKLFFFI